MIDSTAAAGPQDSPPAITDPILRPEARVVRADRSLAAMVLVICTLGGMGVGFGFAMYLMRAQLSYAPFSEARYFTAGGRQVTPLLGVWYDPTRRHDGGTRVDRVQHGTTAEIVGIAAGDIIIAVDGEDTREGDDLTTVIRSHEPGEVVPIALERNGRPMILHARLGFR
jgi:membrane-associated protease RseP (regulator of RpoE activity)